MDTSRNGTGHTATILIHAAGKSSSQACALENEPRKSVWVRAGEIVEDAEFKGMVPPPGPDEQKRIEERLILDGPTEPLIVWACRGRRILLVGYDRIELFKRQGLRFPIIEREFPGREEARLFIIKHHLARPNLSSLEISYLRGLRYDGEKASHGGDRKTEEAQAIFAGRLKSAEALAEIFKVSAATIRRDGALAAAVKKIAQVGGQDIIPILFSRKANLSRQCIGDLAKVEPQEVRLFLGQLRRTGRLSRNWRRQVDGLEPGAITLPLDHERMVQSMLRRMGKEWVTEHMRVFQEIFYRKVTEK